MSKLGRIINRCIRTVGRYSLAYVLTFALSLILAFLLMAIIDFDFYFIPGKMEKTINFLLFISIPFSFVAFYMIQEQERY